MFENRNPWSGPTARLDHLTSVLLFVLATGPALAETTGQLSGVVVDESGAPLPGAAVLASSPAQIGGVQPATSDADGRFLYPRLSPGDYTVTIELDGFGPQQVTGVQVRLDHMSEIRVVLGLATFNEEVKVVAATPVVDPEQISTGQVFTSEYIQEAALGMDNRHYLGLMTQTAGVEQSNRWGLNVLGSTSFENVYLVDGIDTTDSYDQLTSVSTLSFEAVDEVAIHTSGFEAEYGLATGGVVNLITKSGGNAFSGSLDLRYQDTSLSTAGEHLDPEEEPFETRDLNASLGGRILRDRLWFFTSAQSFRDQYTPAGAPSTVDWDEKNFLGKLTWQASSDWSLAAKILGNPILTRHETASQFRAPEAEAKSEWRVLNTHLLADGVLSPNLFFGVRAGNQTSSYDFLPDDDDLTTIGHYNFDTQERYGNWPSQNYDDRERASIETDLTWLREGFMGSHEVKGGLRYTGTGYTSNFCRTGSGQACTPGQEGFFFQDVIDAEGTNVPFRLWAQEAAGPADFTGSIHSLYLQDAWRIRPDLTLKLGLRWDRSRQENDVGQEIADLALLQPRLGVAWDVTGNGRNILRASWGQFMHPSSLHIADFSSEKSSPNELWLSCSFFSSANPEECSALAAAEGLGYRGDPELWDPAGWFLDPGLVFNSVPNATSGGLEPMRAEELLVAFERELLNRTSLELSYVKKDTYDLIEDTCNGNLPTPVVGAACDHWIVTNIPGASRNYEGLILRLESRALDRLHLIGSYVYSESKGSVGGWDLSGGFDFYPYHFENRYGYLGDHSRHRVKVNGFVRFPYRLTLGVGWYWGSEFRWTPLDTRVPGMPYGALFVEPRGNRREPGLNQLDLQLSKAFRVGRGLFTLIGTVYNALNEEAGTWVCQIVSGCGEFEMGDATSWQVPRRYELGVRFSF